MTELVKGVIRGKIIYLMNVKLTKKGILYVRRVYSKFK